MLTKLIMLPIHQILLWQQLHDLLPNANGSIADRQAQLAQASELFETKILPNSTDLAEPMAGKLRAYATESHRLLRLLATDLLFIAAARHPATVLQREQAYGDKLNLLQQYCQAIVSKEAIDATTP